MRTKSSLRRPPIPPELRGGCDIRWNASTPFRTRPIQAICTDGRLCGRGNGRTSLSGNRRGSAGSSATRRLTALPLHWFDTRSCRASDRFGQWPVEHVALPVESSSLLWQKPVRFKPTGCGNQLRSPEDCFPNAKRRSSSGSADLRACRSCGPPASAESQSFCSNKTPCRDARLRGCPGGQS